MTKIEQVKSLIDQSLTKSEEALKRLREEFSDDEIKSAANVAYDDVVKANEGIFIMQGLVARHLDELTDEELDVLIVMYEMSFKATDFAMGEEV